MRKLLASILILCLVININIKNVFADNSQKSEMRAAWITTVYNQDWPSVESKNNINLQKQEFINILDDLKSLGFNTVVVQVRPKGDALYKSELNPWSDVLTGTQGKDPGYDPLSFMIEESHKRGIEFHAWFNPYRITTSGADLSKLSNDSFAKQNPDTVLTHSWINQNTGKISSSLFYDPGMPEVREHIIDSINEVVRNYDVDAIHFDDYFYPSEDKKTFPNGSYNDDNTYTKYGNGLNKDDWRRSNVNTLIRDVYKSIKSIKPNVEFGVSPRGIWKNKSSDNIGSDTTGSQSYYDIYCDTRTWINNGWLDYVTPQLYWQIGNKAADYSKLVDWWSNEVSGKSTKLYIGQGIYKDEVSSEIDLQININRRNSQVKGSMYFSYRDIKNDRQNIRSKIRNLYSIPSDTPTGEATLNEGVIYQTHIQDIGWQGWRSNGEVSGTEGQAKQLEAISIKLNNILLGANVRYRTHIEDIGWQDWKSNGEVSGTEGQSKQLEAIQILLENAPGYSVEYRTHIQDIGWQDWKSNGEISGTEGQSKQLEAIEIRIVKDEESSESNISKGIIYQTHIQDIGWQDWRGNGEVSGTEGQSKQLEAISIELNNILPGSNVRYRTHIEDIGWQDWKSNGEVSGTEGQSKQLEAIQILLENTPGYSIEYRTHIQDIGWQDWKSNGEISGTEGQSKQLEAIQIRILQNQ